MTVEPPAADFDAPVRLHLRPDEAQAAAAVATALADAGEDPAQAGFYDRLWSATQQLPERLRRFLNDFRRTEPSAACLVTGFPVDDEVVGPTPGHWNTSGDTVNRPHEVYLALCGMMLGEPFTWASLQGGRVLLNILPIAGDERRQSGFGSDALLEFHTEDGFHPNRCDYLMLYGLRNHDRVPTILASVRDLKLDDAVHSILGERRFHILPDDEHVRQMARDDPSHPALAAMRQMMEQPEPTAVLFGDGLNPYLRIDRPFMRCADDDTEAEAALDALMAELERVQQDIVVTPGTLLIVDNYLAVHGRRSFQARYDGTDRWLKKLTVSRNLRRGTRNRDGIHHRVLF